MKKTLPRIYILVAAALWGCIGLFYKQLAAIGFTQLQVVWVRVGTAAVLMAIYIWIRDPSMFTIRLRDVWMFIGTGIISLAFFNFCYFNAMDTVSLSVAATLLYTAPIFVMLLSAVLFRENVTVPKVFAVIATVFGCALVTGVFSDSAVTGIGLLFGLGSGIGYALYTIFSVYALRRYRTETVTFYTFVFAGVSVLPLCQPMKLIECVFVQPRVSLFNIFGIGFLACLLPYFLYTKGLTKVPAGTASVMAALEPVVATVIGIVFFHDTVSVQNVCGILLIVSAICLLNVKKSGNPLDKS